MDRNPGCNRVFNDLAAEGNHTGALMADAVFASLERL